MKPLQIRCHTCGFHAQVLLTFVEERELRTKGELRRYCRECRGNTVWDVIETSETSGVFRWQGAEPEEEKALPRVLLIDDDESILAMLRKALKQQPMELETASSARDAAARLVRQDYNVILSDIRMPEFDGKQLFQFLDKHMPGYKQRVIFLTGDTGNPETMAFLEEAGCPYLTKPIDLPALFELLRKSLPQPSEGERDSSEDEPSSAN